MNKENQGAAPPRKTANKTYAQTITARFVASDAEDGSPEQMADLAKEVARVGALLVRRSTPKKGHSNLQLVWRGRAALAAADALLGQAHDDGYRGVWATPWIYKTPAKKGKRP